MKQTPSKPLRSNDRLLNRVTRLIFSALLFLFYRLVVDPRLVYDAQRPVFFYTGSFNKGYLAYPAGPIEWLSHFITQFYTSATLGALLMTAAVLSLALSIRALLRRFSRSDSSYGAEWLIVAPIAALQADYLYPIQYTLSLILIVFVFDCFNRLTAKSGTAGKTIGFFVMTVMLYFLMGALALALPFFLILSVKSFKPAELVGILMSLLIAAAVPQLLFQFKAADPSQLYTCALPLTFSLKQKLIYAGFWLLLFGAWLIIRIAAEDRPFGKMSILLPVTGLLTAGFSAYLLFQPQYKIVLRVNAYAEQRQWQRCLRLLDHHPDLNHRLTNLMRYRALYFTGQLGDRLFEHPHEGADGLYRSDKLSFEFPIAYCDLLIDLGNVNGALHKAYEAWAVEGETPRVLQRLAYLHLAKKQFPAAEKYLHMLAQTGKHRKWALLHRNVCQHQAPDGSADLLRLSQFVERADFLMRPGFAGAELKDIVGTQASRMAVEYLLSHNLLSGRLDLFMENLPLFMQITADLPRAFEEAVVLYLNSGLPVTEAQYAISIRPSTVESFNRFMQILQKHANDKYRALLELQNTFHDSFWFYLLYLRSEEAQ